MTLPRFLVAAPGSGHGKTTVATGLMAALSRAGHTVSGHKVGPDYIDPGYHSLATGRPGRNLDPYLLGGLGVGEHRVAPLLAHGATGADLAVVEGVMGLHDGRIAGDGYASSAHVAALTNTPVVLVVDVSAASRTVAALVHGLASWDGTHVAGVILNKAGSARHAEEVRRALADGPPVLGVLYREDGVEAPARHLGLVPAEERADAAASLDRLATAVAANVDLDAVVRLARTAPALTDPPWSPEAALAEAGVPRGDRPGTSARVAVAAGRAFTFRYAETTELLHAAGVETLPFDPLTDTALPEGATGLYLGGGFPEMHTAELAANTPLLHQVRDAVRGGLPTVAECAGMLYLCRRLRGPEGPPVPLAGVLPADVTMAPRLTLSYRDLAAPTDNLLAPAGGTATGHEFHRTTLTAPGVDTAPVEPPAGDGVVDAPAWEWHAPEGRVTAGFASPTLHASYLHLHWAGCPGVAARFARAAAHAAPLPPTPHPAGPAAPRTAAPTRPTPAGSPTETRPAGRHTTPSDAAPVAPPTPAPDLRHHGDAEVRTAGPGGQPLRDFAVNVYDGPWPGWLRDALQQGLADATRYPSPTAAEQALAARHGRTPDEVLATAGAAEAFGLLARLRDWQHPVTVHPSFTEPDVALREAGRPAAHHVLDADDGFRLDPDAVPERADLVVLGNPTNPTGVRHPATAVRALARPGRLVVVDEAFLEDGAESLADTPAAGVVVLRSLTKLWSIPGIRAGYLLAPPEVTAALRARQTPWAVSTPALAALTACASDVAATEAHRRAAELAAHVDHLQHHLASLGVPSVPSRAPFVLARPGAGVREALRDRGIAVRRGDTFPGLGPDWVRIAAREPAPTDELAAALAELLDAPPRAASRHDGAHAPVHPPSSGPLPTSSSEAP